MHPLCSFAVPTHAEQGKGRACCAPTNEPFYFSCVAGECLLRGPLPAALPLVVVGSRFRSGRLAMAIPPVPVGPLVGAARARGDRATRRAADTPRRGRARDTPRTRPGTRQRRRSSRTTPSCTTGAPLAYGMRFWRADIGCPRWRPGCSLAWPRGPRAVISVMPAASPPRPRPARPTGWTSADVPRRRARRGAW